MSDTPNGAASENATAPDDATVAIGRPRTTLDLAAAKLRTALQERSGYVVVTAESSAAAEALFATVEPRLTTFRTVRASGHGLDPEAIVRSLWRDGEPPFPARLAMRALIDEARAAARPIVVAITDADAAEPARLERVRLTLEGAPDASEIVRIALLGGPALIELLRQPGTRAVAMRIGATVQVPMTTADITPSRDVPAPAPPRGRAPAVAAILAAALGVVAWVLWPQAREPQPLPPRHEVPAAVPPPVALPVPPVGIEEPAADERVAAAPVAATPEAVAPANEPAPPVATPAPEPARPEPAPPAAAVAAPAPAEPFPPRGKAELQVGAFRKPESAEALRAKLAPQFPTVYVATTVRDGTTFHRVRVGGFRSAHDLGIAEAMLRSAGLEPARVASVPSPK